MPVSKRRRAQKPITTAKKPWEVEGIRFSAFPPPSVVFETRPQWQTLIGEPPQEVQERPQQGVRNEFGPFRNDHFFVTQQSSRIDLVFGVHPQKSAASIGAASVGEYAEASKALLDVAEKWLKTAPSLGRLAYAPVLFENVVTVEAGYARLKELLPRLPLDGNPRNVFWQVNRPRKSNVVKDLTINRLSKWHMQTQQRVQLMPDAQKMVSSPDAPSHSVKIELDIYTDPIIPLPGESVNALLVELVDMANEILESGDIP